MNDRDLLGEATERKERIVGWRRELHAHPELRFDLPWTESFVAGRLEEMGWEVRTGVARHGVVRSWRSPRLRGAWPFGRTWTPFPYGGDGAALR
jgi:metal-dependent amidase/aminoacylase/carboxypeptidase family protein